VARQGREVAALQLDDFGFRVVGHLHIEDKRDFATNLSGLPHDHQTIPFESSALDAEATTRLHLPEESDFPVLFGQDPHTEQIAT